MCRGYTQGTGIEAVSGREETCALRSDNQCTAGTGTGSGYHAPAPAVTLLPCHNILSSSLTLFKFNLFFHGSAAEEVCEV